MDDGADRGFIDAQAESDRADQHWNFVGHPFFLITAARGVVHFAVIRDGLDPCFGEQDDGFFDARDGRCVDDYVFSGIRSQRFYEKHGLRAGVTLLYDVAEIGAMEAGYIFVRLAQGELFDDVVPDLLRRTGGEGRDRAIGKVLAKRTELAVFGTKFVAPFGNAVRFVNREERNGDALEPFDGVGAGEALGGEI
jgi:hypothetical protein